MGMSARTDDSICNQVDGVILRYELAKNPETPLVDYFPQVKEQMKFYKETSVRYSAVMF